MAQAQVGSFKEEMEERDEKKDSIETTTFPEAASPHVTTYDLRQENGENPGTEEEGPGAAQLDVFAKMAQMRKDKRKSVYKGWRTPTSSSASTIKEETEAEHESN